MSRNIEIKAVLKNPEEAHAKARELSQSNGIVISQIDTFFETTQGRLKLRCFEDGTGVLVYYERADTQGPRLSDYSLVDLKTKKDCKEMKKILAKLNGIAGVVEKIRHLYMVGQTRIHIDKVTGLGNFLEIEVVMKDKQSEEEGEVICNDLVTKLGISHDDLLANAYIDLLKEKKSTQYDD